MKMTLKRKVLCIVLLSALLVFSAIGLMITNKTTESGSVVDNVVETDFVANAEDTTEIKAILSGDGVVEKQWTDGAHDGKTAPATDFYMDEGASLRVSQETPGLRFRGHVLASVNTWADHPTYGNNGVTNFYTRIFAMEFTVKNPINGVMDKLYAKADLSGWGTVGAGHAITASITFDGLTLNELEQAKSFEISANMIMIRKAIDPDSTSEKVIVVRCSSENTVRTMEAVVNSTLLNPAYDIYEGIGSFKYDGENEFNFINGQVNVSKDNTLYAEQGLTDGTIASNYPVFDIEDYAGTGVTIDKVFIGAERIAVDAGGTTIALDEEFFANYTLGDFLTLSVLGSDGIFYNVPIAYCTKAIRTYSDLAFVRSSNNTLAGEKITDYNEDFSSANSTNRILGNYIVANNITVDDSWTPSRLANDNYARGFCGTFDGNGYTIEYKLQNVGLFGHVGVGAVIKNATFLAKGFYTTNVDCDAYFSLLAGQVKGELTLENLYVKYDFNLASPDIATTNGQSTGLGLFEKVGNAELNMDNIIIDMSNVTGLANAEDGTPFAYGTIAARNSYVLDSTRQNNVFIISDIPYTGMNHNYISNSAQESINNVSVASNDADLIDGVSTCERDGTATTGKTKEFTNVVRFNNFDEVRTYFAQDANIDKLAAFNWVDTTSGYPFAGDKSTSISSQAQLKINGEALNAWSIDNNKAGSATVTIAYGSINAVATLTINDGDASLVSIDGNVINHVAGENYGSLSMTATAEIEGIEIVKDFEVVVNSTFIKLEENIKFSSIDGLGYMPKVGEGETVTKIINKDTKEVYFENDNWSVPAELLNKAETATDDLTNFTETVIVYVDGVAKYQTQLVSYTMVLTKSADLANLYSTTASTYTKGYFILGEDIKYTKGDFIAKPLSNSYFNATLDGAGHTLEYGILQYGLVGTVKDHFVLKDINLVVKDSTGTTQRSRYAGFAFTGSLKWQNWSKMTNVYFSYDIENFQPNVGDLSGGWANSGLGMFMEVTTYIEYTNVIADMSRVDIDSQLSTAYGYGVFGSAGSGQASLANTAHYKFDNTYVIWDVPFLVYQRNNTAKAPYQLETEKGAVVAENDAENIATIIAPYAGLNTNNTYVAGGVNRFANYDEAEAFFADAVNAGKLDKFTNTNNVLGYPYGGNISSHIKESAKLMINGEERSAISIASTTTTALTLTVDFAGVTYSNATLTKKGESDLVTVEGNVATYTAGGANDGFGAEIVSATFDIMGVEVTFDVEIEVTIAESNKTIMYSTQDNNAVVPKEFGTVTKVVEFADKDKVLFDGANWSETNVYQNTGDTLTEDLSGDATKEVIVYVGGAPAYKTTLISYTKVISKGSDLDALRVSGTTNTEPLEGYFIVENDIDYETDPFNMPDRSSFFGGTLDGNGCTVEFGTYKYGLLGDMGHSAVIKDISLVVKNIQTTVTHGAYPILAHNGNAGFASQKHTITNAYFAYDIPNFAPITTEWASGQYVGVGLFGQAPSYTAYTNVMVDFSNLPEFDYGYGAFGTWNANNVVYSTFDDTYVIYAKECLAYAFPQNTTNFRYGHFAESDREAANAFATAHGATISDSGSGTENMLIVMKGVRRFNDTADAKTWFAANPDKLAKFDSFTDTSLGIPLGKDVDSYISANAQVVVNGEPVNGEYLVKAGVASTPATITLSCLNASTADVTVSSSQVLTTFSGNTVNYVGSGNGEEIITVTGKLNGVQVTKTFTFAARYDKLEETVMYSSTDASKSILPSVPEGSKITKIVDSNDASVVYYENDTFTSAVLSNSGTAATSDLSGFTWDVLVYVDDKPYGETQLISYTDILMDADDVAVIYSATSAAAVVNGYYILGQDISFDGQAPTRTYNHGWFSGTLDGNGHTLSYSISQSGLFRGHNAFAVKNISLIITGYVGTGSYCQYSAIAGLTTTTASQRASLSNVFVKYNFDLTPSLASNALWLPSGVGLFAQTPTYSDMSNVVVDMSRLTIAPNASAQYSAYGVFGQYGCDQYGKGKMTIENCAVITDTEFAAFYSSQNGDWATNPGIAIFANDTVNTVASVGEVYPNAATNKVIVVATGLDGYANYEALGDVVLTAGAHTVTSAGVVKTAELGA